MVRTQIYLTEQQRKELAEIGKSQGKKQSELIREAIDILIEQSSELRKRQILEITAGIWRNREDLAEGRYASTVPFPARPDECREASAWPGRPGERRGLR